MSCQWLPALAGSAEAAHLAAGICPLPAMAFPPFLSLFILRRATTAVQPPYLAERWQAGQGGGREVALRLDGLGAVGFQQSQVAAPKAALFHDPPVDPPVISSHRSTCRGRDPRVSRWPGLEPPPCPMAPIPSQAHLHQPPETSGSHTLQKQQRFSQTGRHALADRPSSTFRLSQTNAVDANRGPRMRTVLIKGALYGGDLFPSYTSGTGSFFGRS